MTSRQVYEAILIELNKENAPNILLEDFNYLFNKAINLYVNKRYNIYDINQQTTDDLRVLKATALLTPQPCDTYGDYNEIGRMMGATFEVLLPSDYLHILNCICIYRVKKTFKCYNKGDKWRCAAKRLTADMYSQVLDNFWQRPTYKNPYYYIHNVNVNTSIPTDPIRKIEYKENSGIGECYYYITNEELNSDNIVDTIKNSGEILKVGQNITLNNLYIYVLGPKGFSVTIVNGQFNIVWLPNQLLENISNKYDIYVSSKLNDTYKTTAINSAVYIGTDFKEKSLTEDRYDSYFEENIDLGTDAFNNKIVAVSKNNGVSTFQITNDGKQISTVEKAAQVRYGNSSSVRMEIRYGTDTGIFELSKVYIDYIKSPQYIRLTLEQLDLTEDTSQVLEFPDYVCQEIISELVHIIMENILDPRIQTRPVVSLSIANPAQQLTEPVALLQQ